LRLGGLGLLAQLREIPQHARDAMMVLRGGASARPFGAGSCQIRTNKVMEAVGRQPDPPDEPPPPPGRPATRSGSRGRSSRSAPREPSLAEAPNVDVVDRAAGPGAIRLVRGGQEPCCERLAPGLARERAGRRWHAVSGSDQPLPLTRAVCRRVGRDGCARDAQALQCVDRVEARLPFTRCSCACYSPDRAGPLPPAPSRTL
jgi:hypothetical protein